MFRDIICTVAWEQDIKNKLKHKNPKNRMFKKLGFDSSFQSSMIISSIKKSNKHHA
jgi:hypothetical protein